ncbi:MAG: hypothetical protein MJY69_08120 [Bacteroidales bacterium]|nr:hypothetical protein [Bacteroidales bacterium]
MMILETVAWYSITEALTKTAVFAIMPTLVVWICLKARNKKFEMSADLAKKAIEKDPSLNMADFLAKLSPVKKTYAQKSVSLLMISCILLFLGLFAAVFAALILHYSMDINEDGIIFLGIVAFALLAVGLAFLVVFFYTKKLIGKGQLK